MTAGTIGTIGTAGDHWEAAACKSELRQLHSEPGAVAVLAAESKVRLGRGRRGRGGVDW